MTVFFCWLFGFLSHLQSESLGRRYPWLNVCQNITTKQFSQAISPDGQQTHVKAKNPRCSGMRNKLFKPCCMHIVKLGK